MKYSILFLLLLPVFAFGQPVYSRPAQNKCSAENISLYGVKIGMTQNEVENLFSIKLEVLQIDYIGNDFTFAFIPKNANGSPLKLNYFLIHFFKAKVYSIDLDYFKDTISPAQDAKNLSLDLTEKWQINKSNWISLGNDFYNLKCDSLEVNINDISLGGGASVSIQDLSITNKKEYSYNINSLRLKSLIIVNNTNSKSNVAPLLPEKCSVKFSELPLIRGLQLGMSKTNVLANYPKCRNEIGTTCYYRAEDISSFSFRNGLDAISIAFDLDTNKVSSFSLVYDTSLKWKSSKEFAESISDNLKFEPNNWTAVPQKKPSPFGVMKYSCTNYYATVSFIDNYPNLSIVKSPELIKVENSKRKDDFDKEQERKKKEFKP
jgi:hypothetical protein